MVNHMRHTKGHRNQRRSQQRIASPAYSVCSHCKETKKPHAICANCGYYNGKQVVDVLKKLDKKERKKKEKELAEKEEAKK
jgi:large subunit ribosomal protein L32